MKDNSSGGKMFFIYFHFVNVNGNWARLKIHNEALRSLQYSGYHENVKSHYHKKLFKNICIALNTKIMLCYFKVSF